MTCSKGPKGGIEPAVARTRSTYTGHPLYQLSYQWVLHSLFLNKLLLSQLTLARCFVAWIRLVYMIVKESKSNTKHMEVTAITPTYQRHSNILFKKSTSSSKSNISSGHSVISVMSWSKKTWIRAKTVEPWWIWCKQQPQLTVTGYKQQTQPKTHFLSNLSTYSLYYITLYLQIWLSFGSNNAGLRR